MMNIVIGIAVAVVVISIGIWFFIKKFKPNASNLDRSVGVFTFLSLIALSITLSLHSTPYFKDIDPFTEPCYSPIAYEHSFGLIAIHILSIVSLILLYVREHHLPPIWMSSAIVITCLGILLNLQFLSQISYHDTSRIHLWKDGHFAGLLMSIYPLTLTVISIRILLKMIRNKSEAYSVKNYKNQQLNWLSNKLSNAQNLPVLSILLTAPILLLIIIILALFGQDLDSLTKVYTETATWNLSQHLHPPTVDDRHGHYLCTVAAHGNPKIVKPINIGRRNGNFIIVNRQLQIANAFEGVIEHFTPKIHKVIRHNYDKYGLNLAKRINNEKLSNLTYLIMKPLEWNFLIILYSVYTRPEEIIQRQYKYTPRKVSDE